MYESYVKLTPNELNNALNKRRLHPSTVERIKVEVAQLKESTRTERITRQARKAQWANVLEPLRYELNNARVGRRYGEPTPDRIEAFDAYIMVMQTLLDRWEMPYKALSTTPMQIAKDKNASGKGSAIPNDGAHWTDHVPRQIKERVASLFRQMHLGSKAKRKVPFQRTMLPDQHTKAKDRLLVRTTREMQTLQRRHMVAPTKATATKLERMTQAIKIIEAFTGNEAIPATWNALA